MFPLYTLFIRLYTLAIRLAAPFSPKAGLWIKGRKGVLERLKKELKRIDPEEQRKRVWFHCASLGEFEQGRPVIEAWRTKYPNHLVVLTFFSPSGYEVRKQYPGADLITYLPSDTPRHAKVWLDLIRPERVFFIKYEYWYNYLRQIANRKIPVYILSAIFRPDQHFFRWYGGWFRERLRQIDHFFVQDDVSAALLKSKKILPCSLTGDTRFDRVWAIALENREIPMMAEFSKDATVVMGGSTWPADEKLLEALIREARSDMKFVIAPHETDPVRIRALMDSLGVPSLRYSEATPGNIGEARVLVIDSVGMLSHLYRYASFALIGGGFGAGIHNILEASAFGVPVVFGPNHGRFAEARELITRHGAFPVDTPTEFLRISRHLLDNPGVLQTASGVCSQYVLEKQGATERICRQLFTE